MAIRGDVDRAGIPQISMAGGTAITGTFDKLVYQTPWSNTLVVPFVLKNMKDLGHTKVALLTSADGYGKDGKAIILAEAPKAGVTIVSDQTFNPGDSDFSAQLTKMKASGADAMLLWTAGKDAANIVKTSKDLGIIAAMVRRLGSGAQGVPRRRRGRCRGLPVRHRQEPRSVDVGDGL